MSETKEVVIFDQWQFYYGCLHGLCSRRNLHDSSSCFLCLGNPFSSPIDTRIWASSPGSVFRWPPNASIQLSPTASERPENISASYALHEPTLSRSASQLTTSASHVPFSPSQGLRLFPAASSPFVLLGRPPTATSAGLLHTTSSCLCLTAPQSVRSSVS